MEENGITLDKKASFLHGRINTQMPKIPMGRFVVNPWNGKTVEKSLWLWDMGQHGTTIKWKTFSMCTLWIPSNGKIPMTQQNTQLGVFLRPLAMAGKIWDMMTAGRTKQWKTYWKKLRLHVGPKMMSHDVKQ